MRISDWSSDVCSSDLEEGNPALKLRVYIQGGGCSGFQYGFEFDEQPGEDDLASDTDDVVLLVDPLSLQYLLGAPVGYAERLHGAPFTITNPNTKSTSGYASTFPVKAAPVIAVTNQP